MASISQITEKELDGSNRQLWLKALSAIQQNNSEYAITLLLPVVKSNPGFLEGRITLRKCQSTAAGAKSGGTKVFGLSIGGKGKSASSKVKSLAKKDPSAALSEIEEELTEDPASPDLNDLLHDVACKLGMVSTAEFALETVRKAAPSNTKLLHKLAQFYIANQKFADAAGVYKTISTETPTDSDAIKGEKDCMAKASMQATTTVSADGQLNLKVKDDAERVALERKSRTGMTKDQLKERRDSLIAEYNADTQNIDVVKQLSEAYEKLDDYQNAHTFYSWAYQLSENDKTLLNKASEMKEKLDKAQIKAIEQQLEEDPNNAELLAQLKELSSSTIKERIAELSARVEENPTDADLRFSLGKAYFEAEMYGEAIPHLQQARSNPSIETKTLLLLGQTFDAKGMTDMAIAQLEKANQQILIMDGMKKETLYQLALLREKLGDKEGYIEALKEIYSADYGYRDVASRVESTY